MPEAQDPNQHQEVQTAEYTQAFQGMYGQLVQRLNESGISANAAGGGLDPTTPSSDASPAQVEANAKFGYFDATGSHGEEFDVFLNTFDERIVRSKNQLGQIELSRAPSEAESEEGIKHVRDTYLILGDKTVNHTQVLGRAHEEGGIVDENGGLEKLSATEVQDLQLLLESARPADRNTTFIQELSGQM